MRRVIPGLETPESLIEPEIGARLDRVEEELEKAVVADSDLLSATLATSCRRAVNASAPCSSCWRDTSAIPPTLG